MLPKLSAKLRELHNLPDSWEVFRLDSLPPGKDTITHIQITGAESRPLKSGPRKGKTFWPNKGNNGRRAFVFTCEEYDALLEKCKGK